MVDSCPFCARIAAGQVEAANDLACAFFDGFPVSPGHLLVVPRRHEPDFFQLNRDEQVAVLDLLNEMRARLAESHRPDAFNLGLNSGPAAGQTVGHAHVHLIPRFHGDVQDPRGGVRWVLPAKADYWSRRG